jgi:hypothetical protein
MARSNGTRVGSESRLEALGVRIDALQDKARRLRTDARVRANRRVDDLRAREAEARADLRDLRSGFAADREADREALGVELCELENAIEIADAELDVEMATDAEAFVRAGERAAAAWDAYLDGIDERADAAARTAIGQLHASVGRARALADETHRRIEHARSARDEGWTMARKEAASDIARYLD